jgi:hypothetical protein
MTLAGSVGWPFPPEGGRRVGFTPVVGRQLQQDFGTAFGPELLGPFDSPVDLLDG